MGPLVPPRFAGPIRRSSSPNSDLPFLQVQRTYICCDESSRSNGNSIARVLKHVWVFPQVRVHAAPHSWLALVVCRLVERVQAASAACHAVSVPRRSWDPLASFCSSKSECESDLPTRTGAVGCQLASRTQVPQPPGSSNQCLVCRSLRRVAIVAFLTSIVPASVASMFHMYTLPSALPE